MWLLECLRGRGNKPTEALFLKCFSEREKIAAIKSDPSGQDICQQVIEMMATGPEGEAQAALVAAHASLSPEGLSHAFLAARRTRTPAEVFQTFSPYLTAKVDEKKKERDPAFAKRLAICDEILAPNRQGNPHYAYASFYRDSDETLPDLDPRWLDVATQLASLELVMGLARAGHEAANRLLAGAFSERLKKSKDLWECGQILQTMVRVQHPAATDATIAAIQKFAQGNQGYGLYWIGQLIPNLPKDALPKLEALLPTLPDKVIDQLLDYVTQLKSSS